MAIATSRRVRFMHRFGHRPVLVVPTHLQDEIAVAGQATVDMIATNEAWFEVSLDNDWTAAYRIVPQDGHPVIAEVRVFPNEPENLRNAGEWSGVHLGLRAIAPKGGITARLLREIRLSDASASDLAAGRAAWRRYLGLAPRAKQMFAKIGFRRLRRLHAPKGGRRWSEDQLLRAAAFYVERVSAGSRRPVAELKEHFGFSKVQQARDLLHTARQKGLLTAGSRGRGHGALTERAQKLLSETRKEK